MNLFKKYTNYLKDNPERYWFKRKLYGWGWTPATREGWLVLLGYIIFFVAGELVFIRSVKSGHFTTMCALVSIAYFVIITALLIRICYKKGEKPEWQWGPPKK